MQRLIFLFVFILTIFSCSNISDTTDEKKENDIIKKPETTSDFENIGNKINSKDSLLVTFDKYLGGSGNGIFGRFTYSVKYGNGYSSGSYSYSYTYNFETDGKYTVSYSQSIGTGNGSNGYSVPSESGTFSLSYKEDFYYITMKDSKGEETSYRYLVSEHFLVLLPTSDTTNYKIDLDEATFKFNAENEELSDLEKKYSRESGYDGILGKWVCHIGKPWTDAGKDVFGNYYSNTYWPRTYEVEFCIDGIFNFTRTEVSKENGFNRKENIVKGVFGVIETGENELQLGLVSYSEKKLLTKVKVSNKYLYCEKDINEIFSSFEVIYESEFGTVPDAISVEENTKLTKEQLPALVYNGYSFLGWYVDDEKIIADKYTITKNIILKAKWKQIGYLVTFETNCETSIPKKILSYLRQNDIPEISREGYTFGGWYINSILTNPITNSYKVQQPMTIYAKWLMNYKVSFETNSDIYMQSFQTASIETMPEISRDGYIFAGWYLDASFSKKAKFPLNITTDTVLYANWKNYSEAKLVTNETINAVNPIDFTQPCIIFIKGELTYSDLWDLCYRMKDSAYPVCVSLIFVNGINSIAYYTDKNYYVVYHKDWTGTFQTKYLKNVIIDWYEITNR
jgi:uncharacterized repeat protein (TIGR02543 family)